MYLHLGQNEIVPDHRIIGIFDHPQIVYLSQLNTSTLKNRAESGKLVL